MSRILIAVTHLLGAGHLTRAASLARAFAGAGHAVTLVSGGMPAALPRLDRIRLVQLPPVRIRGTAFTTLLDEDLAPVGPERLEARRAALLAAVAQADPDAVITELHPFGRRVLAPEFDALAGAVAARRPRPLLLASLRDILARPSRPERVAATHARFDAYDGALVHGDPDLLPLDASWPVEAALRPRLHYTGYVDEGEEAGPARAAERAGIVVSGGSSAAGLPLQEAALGAARLLPGLAWRVLVGRAVPEAAFADLRARAPGNAVVERARPDFRALLAGAALSVSQAGYNTVLDLLRSRCPALLVPFEAGGETEQRLRAETLAGRGLARVLPEADLSAERLAGMVEAMVGRAVTPPPSAGEGAPRSGAGEGQHDASSVVALHHASGLSGTGVPLSRPAHECCALAAGHPPPQRGEGYDSDPVALDGAARSVAIVAAMLADARAVDALDWAPLDAALARLAAEGRTVTLWWRDDDAVADTPALDRLLTLSRRSGWPVALAAIPASTEPSLTARVADEPEVDLLVHGLSHANHAGADKKAEFGLHRPPAVLAEEARRGLALAAERCGPRLLPVLVPPWNRIAPDLVGRLPSLGYRGLSTFGRRAPRLPGLVQVNTHLDPVDWHGTGRGLVDPVLLIRRAAEIVADPASIGEPVGLLTHHLAQSRATWTFCAAFLERLAEHPAVRVARAARLFAPEASPVSQPGTTVTARDPSSPEDDPEGRKASA